MGAYSLSKRLSIEEIEKEKAFIRSLEYFKEVFNLISSVTIVLSDTRQLVFASNSFMDLLQISNDSSILGYRPG